MGFFILWISFRVSMVGSKGVVGRLCLGHMTPVCASNCTCSTPSLGGVDHRYLDCHAYRMVCYCMRELCALYA